MSEPPRKKARLSKRTNKRKEKVEEPIDPKNTLYVNNLDEKINTKRLRTNLFLLFSIYGEVLKVAISAKKQRGQAFITMRTVDEANLALISLNNEPFFDKPLHIQFSKTNSYII
ncbi:hypothetical protein NCAS_0A12190 [Naumovozyma castellii]|uniref:RRM domain-containing protein n=1 Tax=Naumovozyma castellii TaxID=27288 RepID=G0V8H9_NAUCA|nr:hypothetical protein NCAS_0A12190 [Naumovozyma castellii CBS 4309]CCC67777.1 hypothetical protein NCAS_0A12190 [Naumovozyma castellii CBS 4309]